MRTLILLLFIVLSLASCGFHLRGPMPLAPPLQRLYLQTPDPYGQLTRDLRLYFKMSNVHLVESPTEASTVLVILDEETNEQLLNINGTQETRQYNLILTVHFQITDSNGAILLSPEAISETRVLTIKAGQILAGSNEANNIYQQMRLAIAYDIMSRLASQNVTQRLTKP